MNTRKIANVLKRISLGLAVAGTTLYATSSCSLSNTLNSLLSSLGLSTST